MTPEAKVKRRVVRQLKEIGAYYFAPVTGGYGRSGVPDIVGCFDGMFFAIECKAGRNKPTPLQQKNIDDITSTHGVVWVANEDNADDTALILLQHATKPKQTENTHV